MNISGIPTRVDLLELRWDLGAQSSSLIRTLTEHFFPPTFINLLHSGRHTERRDSGQDRRRRAHQRAPTLDSFILTSCCSIMPFSLISVSIVAHKALSIDTFVVL